MLLQFRPYVTRCSLSAQRNAAEVERTRYLEGVSQRNVLRMQTLRALTAGPRAVAIPRLLQMLASDSRDAAAAADAIVKHFLGPEVIDGLKAGLSHPAIGARWHCVDELSKIAGRRHEAGVWAPGQAEFCETKHPSWNTGRSGRPTSNVLSPVFRQSVSDIALVRYLTRAARVVVLR